MFYKALGFAVWQGAKFYVGHKLPSRRLMGGGARALAVATLVAAGTRRDNGGD